MPSCCVEGISAQDWAGFSCEPRGGGLVVSRGNKDMHEVTVCIHVQHNLSNNMYKSIKQA